MHGEGKYVLRQIQELLCLREFIATDSYKAIFLEESQSDFFHFKIRNCRLKSAEDLYCQPLTS